MSSTRAEKFVVGILELFHNDTRHHDTTDKPALLKTLQEDFPKFLSACVSWGLACLGQGEALICVWRGCDGRASPVGSDIFEDSCFAFCFWMILSLILPR